MSGLAKSLDKDFEKNGTGEHSRPLKARTEEVYTKAAMLFKQNGYQNTPLASIGKELNIQKASLYYYIKDKETLLFKILNRTMDTMLERVGNLPIQDLAPNNKLERVIYAHIINASRYLNEFSVLLQDTKHLRPDLRKIVLFKRKQYEEIFLKIIDEGISKKIFVRHDPKMLVYLILGSCNWLYQWFSLQGPKTPEQIAGTFSDVFLNGLLRK
jgi:AcrR family transcriptional regulator